MRVIPDDEELLYRWSNEFSLLIPNLAIGDIMRLLEFCVVDKIRIPRETRTQLEKRVKFLREKEELGNG